MIKKTILTLFLFFAVLIISNTANAETGTITVSTAYAKISYTFGGGGVFSAIKWDTFNFDSGDYNSISDYYVIVNNNAVFNKQGNYTYFSCSSGCTGNGYASYNKLGNIINWDFAPGFAITASPFVITYETNIFDTNNIHESSPLGKIDTISLNNPVSITDNAGHILATIDFGNGYQVLNHSAHVLVSTSINYNSTYPEINKFAVKITKTNNINNMVKFQSQTLTYWNETGYNTNSFTSPILNYLDGLFINLTLQVGGYNNVLINSTGISGISAPAPTISTDKLNYKPLDTITITASNPLGQTVFLTAYGQTGIITEIAWNTPINPGSTTFSKTIPSYLPFGSYTLNVAGSDSYTPILAQTTFNITTASNTSNTLSLLWDKSIYKIGNTGIIRTTSNFNASTLNVLSPSGISKSFIFPANSTNTTGINLNEVGIWQAKITDNGNASNFITALTEVTSGNPTANETILLCTQTANYICFDKNNYTQGQAFVISFKLIPKVTDIASLYPWVELVNPQGAIEYNQSVNVSWNENLHGFAGTLSGSFTPQALTGVWFARLKTKDILGQTEIRAESGTVVNSGYVPTPIQTVSGQQTIDFIGSTSYLALLIMVVFVGIGASIAGAVGFILGIFVSIPLLFLAGLIPMWVVFLDAGTVFLGIAIYTAFQLTKTR